ncbi:PadR family transcriptional regulator [Robertmurraya andreesenii]|uniref:DNA-binding PadR family transcriptional regulator n=1 Tax=Anoxybacillus andreesenii TaxID=1325932 RepID=A0ABT9V6V9_9BACL|nr:PadR family transcriptional regulator [Robertmurraya andreesenii]MDQ0156685.1 DNA-binding PadR family transcriptional regulator [Robertmurraya andreesenii]
MEEQLKKLKNTMNQTVFKDVVFSEKHRSNILAKLNEKKNPELDVLQLLQTSKTGYEVSQALIARGVKNFAENEGMLYVLLHELEGAGYLTSTWENGEKYYQISTKGKKRLVLEEEQMTGTSLLKKLAEGGV